MSDLTLTILPETAKDAQPIERLLQRTFGPGRFVLSSYRLREHVDHLLDLSFTARIGTLLVGSVRLLPVCIGDTMEKLGAVDHSVHPRHQNGNKSRDCSEQERGSRNTADDTRQLIERGRHRQ